MTGGGKSVGESFNVTDDLGREVAFEETPKRIISLVPSITETLFLFGVRDRVLAISDYCIHPRFEVDRKEKIGGPKSLDVHKILWLEPDLVIANAEENRKDQIKALIKAGVRVFITYPKTVEGAIRHMRQLATITGAEEEAAKIIEESEQVNSEMKERPEPEKRDKVLCLIWRDPLITVNGDTYISDMIELAGGRNVFADGNKRYPKITLDDIHFVRPDVILLPTEPYAFSRRDRKWLGRQMQIPAARANRIFLVEGELICWFGPRLGRGLKLLRELFQRPAFLD